MAPALEIVKTVWSDVSEGVESRGQDQIRRLVFNRGGGSLRTGDPADGSTARYVGLSRIVA